jgi:hypothetical protein
MSFRRAAKVDSNQAQIVEALRKIGAYVVHTHQLKNAFDILVSYRGRLTPMEIKDGNKFPKKFFKMSEDEKESYLVNQLTDGERDCMMNLIATNTPYTIVYDIDSAIKAIN